jgi:hypothetical protein
MNTKLVASAVGAVLLAGSTLAVAGDWNSRNAEQWGERSRHERSWSGHDRDWGDDRRHSRGHGHYRGHGHWKPYWHHHYRHHHHGYWRPHGYDRDGVTIIFRGSFY